MLQYEQKQSKEKYRGEISTFTTTNILVSIGPARLGEKRQAAIWALLCGSCPVQIPPRCCAASTTTR